MKKMNEKGHDKRGAINRAPTIVIAGSTRNPLITTADLKESNPCLPAGIVQSS